MHSDADEWSIEAAAPFRLRVGVNGWQHTSEHDSAPSAFGLHSVTIRRADISSASTLEWTRFDVATQSWEGVDHIVRIAPSA